MDIHTFSLKHNCLISICDPSPLPDRSAPFLSRDNEKRTHPEALLPGVRSIIVVGLPHDPPVYANLATLATNPDYHPRVKNLLRQLAESLPPHQYRILADSPYLDERALAVRAGIGFYGKNGLIIAPKVGSFFNIGYLLTDLELPFNEPCVKSCPSDCYRCVEACPVKLDKTRCLSYLTQKKDLSKEEKRFMNGQLYGCDLCQTVCPFNKIKPPQVSFLPEAWLTADDEQLKTLYGHTAMWWRGPDVMRRNALVNLHNHRF